jgi:hypothetical protein
MKWTILALVLLFFVADNKKESYLSDRIPAYKDIEEIQRGLRSRNYFLRYLNDTIFTKSNARQLILTKSESIHTFSFVRDTSINQSVAQLFDKCIPGDYPTRYQDPFTYCIFANLIEKVSTVGQAITKEQEQPRFGTIFDNSLNAEKISLKNVYLLLINSRLTSFSHQSGKAALQPILIQYDPQDSNFIAFGLDHGEIDSVINGDKAIKENFLYTMLEFHYLNMPPNDSLKLAYVYFEKALSYWNNSFEDFLLGHEFAHQLLHHNRSRKPDADFNNLDSWYQEVAADSLSQLILDTIVLSNANDQNQIGWNKYLLMGGKFLLTTLGVYERSVSIIESNREIKSATEQEMNSILELFDWNIPFEERLRKFKTLPDEIRKADHPPVEARLELLDRVAKKVLEQKLHTRQDFNDVEDLHYSLASSMLYGIQEMYNLSLNGIFNAYRQRNQLEQYK